MVKIPSHATVPSGLTKKINNARAKASICSVEDFALYANSGTKLFFLPVQEIHTVYLAKLGEEKEEGR
jgi:hypothetical protein